MKKILFTTLFLVAGIITVMAQCNALSQGTPPTQSVCYNSSATINLAAATGGDSGNTYLWEQSTSGSSGWTNASGINNTQNYRTPNLTSNMYYRRKVTSGCDGTVNTGNAALISVYPQLQITSQSVQQTICYSTAPEEALSITATGGASLTYQWQQSSTGTSGWTNVSNGTGVTYRPATLIATTYYRCRVTSGNSCGTAISGNIAVNVLPDFSTGTIAGEGETICYNTPATTIISTQNASGGDGNITYKWLRNGMTIPDYSSPDFSTFTPTEAGTYTRLAKDGRCSTTLAPSSGSWTLTVRDGFNAGSITSGRDTICLNTQPDQILNSANASGGDNDITYRWKVNGNDITGTDNAGYTPPVQTVAGIYNYTREAKDNICTNGNYIQSGGIFTLTVLPGFTVGSIATTGETICHNTPATTITSIQNAEGGSGNIIYEWRKNGTIVSGSNSPNFTPTEAGLYTRWVKDSKCTADFAQSTGSWTLTIRDEFNAGSISTTGETICNGGQPVQISSAVEASGGNAPVAYRWKVNDEVISNSDLSAYTPPVRTEAGIYNYTREVKDATCNNWTASSGNWMLVVDPLPGTPQAPTGSNFVCQLTEKNNYEIQGNSDTDNYDWDLSPAYAGTVAGNGSKISVYWNPEFSGTANLKVKGINACSESSYSQPLPIRVKETPEVQFTQVSNPVCSNSKELIYSVGHLTNVTYNWQIEQGQIISDNTGNSVIVNWNKDIAGSTGKLFVNVTDNDGCEYNAEYNVSMSSGSAPDLNDIAFKTGKNGDPYILLYPNPSGEYMYQWYKNELPVKGATKQFFYPPDFGETLEKDAVYKVYVSEIHDSLCGNFTNTYEHSPAQTKNVKIFPNPSVGDFTIYFNDLIAGSDVKTAELKIYSVTGTLIFQSEINTENNYIHNSKLNPGVYIISIKTGNYVIITEKLIVK
ncbi:MAG: T9SS type A sorting domain-containing protein [Bacteroidales bacterium]|jgi:hypothetical protein|nr:T9SS type A sorting domain-containing protein [Bacteroidales bacterium]